MRLLLIYRFVHIGEGDKFAFLPLKIVGSTFRVFTTKNCEDLTHSIQSAVLIQKIHALTYIYGSISIIYEIIVHPDNDQLLTDLKA